jgi:hypothetical protein
MSDPKNRLKARLRGRPREQQPAARPAPAPPCAHLGQPTGATVACATCSGTVALKVFACAVHGTCFPRANAVGLRSCDGCADRRATEAPETGAKIR